ncbi:NAD(P)/FAD-dependent oxidoreductase [Candidatus Acetothermia bacterium]|nr:NAD(P)/FAD-dependent oxidoreductase [Candidatus Acetothermia bacterium]MBI3643964.1 NAD(P)/FAD-dependent oxidoreductase [Candidatus Acetothermia bacterium]
MPNRDTYDVVVVGGGPAGAVAARESARRGASVLLIEERRQIGLPVQCTGLLSVRGFEAAEANPDVILREVRGAFAHAPDGRILSVESPRVHAYVMDRDRFDCNLVELARNAGVEVQIPARAVGFQPGKLSVQADGKTEVIKTKVVIGADGPQSRVARWAGLAPPEKFIVAIQVTIPYEPEREDFVHVYLSRTIAPAFFAWAVPSTRGYARVGLGTDDGKKARTYLDCWLNKEFPGRTVMGFNAGAIPIGPVERTVSDGVLLVGDAAGQAKPTSGGGIFTGISCAKIAAEVAMRAVSENDVSKKNLSEYEKRWRELFEMELRFGMLAHELLCRMSDEEISKVFETADDPELLTLIGEHGDIDYPSGIAKALLKKPALWGKFLQVVPWDMDLLIKALRYLL